MLIALLRALRPTHWSKNAFVLAPLLFARRWEDGPSVQLALLALGLWCAAASAVYLFNDVRDREEDRLHPLKKLRPVAAGALPVPVALGAAALLAAGALLLGWLFLAPTVGVGLGAYLLLNLAYSLHLKKIPYLDVSMVAAGFVLRVFTGAVAIAVPASPWLLTCAAGLALFLALAKRRAELARTRETDASARKAVQSYDLGRLDLLCRVMALVNTVAYGAYGISPTTVSHIGDARMALTLPFVALGHWRYLHLLKKGEGEDPTRLARKDPFLLCITLGWVIACALLLAL
ncbi:MAG: decaprenyl-phosphate phosphoribosyltransferase [Deltaproteobacteria bacterium]|nr:decaprenyl-phosphate phosphoribosyltransferase [Deltaproteobacteria bacterium]